MLDGVRHKIKYRLSKEYRREVDALEEIKRTFTQLPRCQPYVIVANPDYGEGEYQATITMPAIDLLAWVNAKLESGSPLYTDKVFLPLLRDWLRDAEESGSEQSRFPAIAYEVIEREIKDWIERTYHSLLPFLCLGDSRLPQSRKRPLERRQQPVLLDRQLGMSGWPPAIPPKRVDAHQPVESPDRHPELVDGPQLSHGTLMGHLTTNFQQT